MKKIILTVFFISILSASSHAVHPGGTVSVDVKGLVCDFCARALEKVFGAQEEVESIGVDLDTKVITIHFNEGLSLDDEIISKLIEDSGYNVERIIREP